MATEQPPPTPPRRLLIGLCGLAGSGKSTVGEHLQRAHGFVALSFSALLKDVVALLFGWDRALLEGDTPESRAWRETADAWWSARAGQPVMPRGMLQKVGTQGVREQLWPSFWMDALDRRLAALPADARVVITDCRFDNELDFVRARGGAVWVITRAPQPHWWEAVATAADAPTAAARAAAVGVHASETAWIVPALNAPHVLLDNGGTVGALHRCVDAALLPPPGAVGVQPTRDDDGRTTTTTAATTPVVSGKPRFPVGVGVRDAQDLPAPEGVGAKPTTKRPRACAVADNDAPPSQRRRVALTGVTTATTTTTTSQVAEGV